METTALNLKKITFFSALVISVGSTIGAGIFFKNSSVFRNADGQLGFAIAAWIVAAIGILAIGLALVEVASANHRDGGIVDWVKKFASKRIGKYSASYMILIYIPLTYVALPLYAVQAIQDATANTWVANGWTVASIAFAFFLWFAIMGFFRFKFAEKVQWVFTVLKFLPLLVIPLLGIIQTANEHTGVATSIDAHATGLTGFSPWLGLIASVPAILFAFDGFYTVVSLQSRLPNPRRVGAVAALAIAVVTGAYLFYAILTGIVGKTSPDGVSFIKNNAWLGGLINGIIACAILGIVNGYAMSSPNVYLTIANEDRELAFSKWMMRWKVRLFSRELRFKNAITAAWFFSVVLTVFFYLVLTPIGIYVWNARSISGYGSGANNLYELADLLTNFTSMIIFVFIGFAILGAIINRSTARVEVVRRKYFLFCAYVSVIFLGLATLYLFISEFANMFSLNGGDQLTAIVRFVILGVTSLLASGPMLGNWAYQKWRTKLLIKS